MRRAIKTRGDLLRSISSRRYPTPRSACEPRKAMTIAAHEAMPLVPKARVGPVELSQAAEGHNHRGA